MASSSSQIDKPASKPKVLHSSDWRFHVLLGVVGGIYVLALIGLLLADLAYLSTSESPVERPTVEATTSGTGKPKQTSPSVPALRPVVNAASALVDAFRDKNIRYSFKLTMISCLFSAILSVMVAVPLGYAL
jgi:hypothetical protein